MQRVQCDKAYWHYSSLMLSAMLLVAALRLCDVCMRLNLREVAYDMPQHATASCPHRSCHGRRCQSLCCGVRLIPGRRSSGAVTSAPPNIPLLRCC
jgi:hypothetical protein